MRRAARLLAALGLACALAGPAGAERPRSSPWPFDPDPFAGLDRLHERMRALLEEGPLAAQPGGAGDALRARVERSTREVALVLELPGLDRKGLRVDVDESAVSASWEERREQVRRDAAGRDLYRSVSSRRQQAVLPVPEDAEPRGARVEKDGDAVRVVFPRRKPGPAWPEGPKA